MGEKFRSRALKFPGLISGCTIDWFSKWPKDALVEVSFHFLGEFDIVCTPDIKEELVMIMADIQDGVSVFCESYYNKYIIIKQVLLSYFEKYNFPDFDEEVT